MVNNEPLRSEIFCCEECDYKSSERGDLKMHKKNNHIEEPIPAVYAEVTRTTQKTFIKPPTPVLEKRRKNKSKYLEKPKILLVADSVGRNIDYRQVEKASNVRIRTRKAYSSVSNRSARWPALNVTDVTKQEINNTAHEDNYDVLMLSAPTVDITNLDTAKVKASDNI